MNLLEYEAKQLLEKSGMPIPHSSLLGPDSMIENLAAPVVLKSQVPTGGRGKAGGIRLIEDPAELPSAIRDLFSLSINSFKPSKLLAEERLDIAQEYYIAVLINRDKAEIQLMAHIRGGVEVEENDSEEFLTLILDPQNAESTGEKLADYFELPAQSFALQDMIENLYYCFVKNDALLLEINPLVLTTDNSLIAGDCKLELDDAASFRHPEWRFENKPADANFVVLNPRGTVATIANGAGLAMATVDAVKEYDMEPANFLDIGGGATTDKILAAFKDIMKFPHIEAIIINIFAGITRSDEVARAVIEAKRQLDDLPPLYIRLAGTNFERAVELLSKENIATLTSLEECLEAAKEVQRA